MSKSITWTGVIVVVAVLCGGAVWALRQSRGAPTAPPAVAPPAPAVPARPEATAPTRATVSTKPAESPAERAVDKAAAKHRYAIITVYRQQDPASDTMRAVVKAKQARVVSRADLVEVDRDNAANQALITRLGLEKAPIPIALVVAPNGAVTAGFPNEMKSDVNLAKSFVSTGMSNVLKVLQGGKLAVVCLQNSRTALNTKNQALAKAIAADPQLASVSEVLTMDPADRMEADFYKQCKVTTGTKNAQVLLLVPPGKVVGVFDADTSKDAVMAKIQSACSGGSCGPSGCGP